MLTFVGEIRNNRNDRYYCYCELTLAQISRGEEVVGLIDGVVGIQPCRCVRAVHDAASNHAVTYVSEESNDKSRETKYSTAAKCCIHVRLYAFLSVSASPLLSV